MARLDLPTVKVFDCEIVFLPVLHGRLEFAAEVNRRLKELRAEAVAVEYPPTLAEKILRGVKRLPHLSVVAYEEQDGTTVYLLIEPVEPLIEAVRVAQELSLPVHFVDLDVEGHPGYPENFPDSYLCVLAHKRVKDVFQNSPFINKFIEIKDSLGFIDKVKLIRALYLKKFDTALMLKPSFTKSLICKLAGIKDIVGFKSKKFTFAGIKVNPPFRRQP